jgi:hypothetical protein
MLIIPISTMVLLMALMPGWIEVQRAARRVAAQHPETGPLRLVGAGCGGGCDDCEDACETPDPSSAADPLRVRVVEEFR